MLGFDEEVVNRVRPLLQADPVSEPESLDLIAGALLEDEEASPAPQMTNGAFAGDYIVRNNAKTQVVIFRTKQHYETDSGALPSHFRPDYTFPFGSKATSEAQIHFEGRG